MASPQAKVPVICEYFVQNDYQMQDPYRNVFILPAKYAHIKDVRLRDVIRAFPLKDDQYILRFQYPIHLASKKVKPVWLDVGKNLDVPCPHVAGKIIIKALRLPEGVNPGYDASAAAPVEPVPMRRPSPVRAAPTRPEFENPVKQPTSHSTQKPRSTGLINDGFSQPSQGAGGMSMGFGGTPGGTPGGPPVGEVPMRQSDIMKNRISDTGTPGGSFEQAKASGNPFPGAADQQQPAYYDPYAGYGQANLDGDSDDSGDNGFKDMGANMNSEQQNDGGMTDIFGAPAQRLSNGAPMEGDLFGDGGGFSQDPFKQDSSEQEYTEAPDWASDPFAGSENIFDAPPSQQQTGPATANFFDSEPAQAQPFNQGAAQNLVGDLSALNDIQFAMPTQTPGGPSEEQPVAGPTNRIDQVRNIQAAQTQAAELQAMAREKHRTRLEGWVGAPQKNHVRVLLCTLPDILWEGHGQQRMGIDKLMEPAAVRSAYRKYIAKFHPDKVLNSGDEEKIYIATTAFAAITEQWKIFSKENGIK